MLFIPLFYTCEKQHVWMAFTSPYVIVMRDLDGPSIICNVTIYKMELEEMHTCFHSSCYFEVSFVLESSVPPEGDL